MKALNYLVELAYETGYYSAKVEMTGTDQVRQRDMIAERNSVKAQIDADMNSIRLILRNCSAELPKKHWLQKDLALVERLLNGEIEFLKA